MNYTEGLHRYTKTINLNTTPASRFVVFSDAHRGDGTGADDFAANSLIFKCGGNLRVHRRRSLWGLHWDQMGKCLATGAVFKEAGRPSVVLTGNFLAG